MTAEKEYFLSLLSNHIAGKKTASCTEVDWKALLALSKVHQVEGIVFYQCRKLMPQPIYACFEKAYKVALYLYKKRESDYQAIDERFSAAGIRHFCIKGFEVAAHYPVPYLRTMGDLDVIVSRADKERADIILRSLGFRQSSEQKPDYDWRYTHNSLHYELHHKLIYDEVVTKSEQAKFFNNYWDYVNDGKLDWSFHLLFLIAHLRKHILNAGAGFRMFMDLAIVIHHVPCLNWAWMEEKLDALEMKKFSGVCFALIDNWFDVKAPIDYPRLEDKFVDAATERIFANGIFGFNDIKNKTNTATNGILRYKNKRGFSRGYMLLQFMFPKYKHMRYIPAYRFVNNRPWLLPVAWLFRYARLFMGATSGTKRTMAMIAVSDKTVDDRETELRNWGLL